MKIKDDTITIAVDMQGGMCDRLMLGTKGILNNARASLDCWKLNAPDDMDIQTLKNPIDVDDALFILSTDNFHVEVVTSLEDINELLEDKVELDFNNIEFKDNLYRLY